MTTCEIFFALGAWLVWTVIILFVGRWLHEKRGWLYSGLLALLGAIVGTLLIYIFFEQALQCQQASCWADKARADTLLHFVLITWGAMGGAMLARAVDERE